MNQRETDKRHAGTWVELGAEAFADGAAYGRADASRRFRQCRSADEMVALMRQFEGGDEMVPLMHPCQGEVPK